MLTATTYEKIADLPALSDVWEQLSVADSKATLFNSFAWIESWIRCYWLDTYSLRITIVSYGNEAVALVPIYFNSRFGKWMLLATGEPEQEEIASEYTDILLSDSCLERDSVLEKILEILKPLSKEGLLFRNCLDSSRIFQLASQLGRTAFRKTGSVFQLDLNRPFNEILSTYSRNHRKKTREILNRFNANSRLDFQPPSSDGYLLHWKALRKLHSDDWGSRGKPGAFAMDRFNEFHNYLRINHPEVTPLFATLTIDTHPIAINFYYQFGNFVHFYQSGINKTMYGNLSPGILLHTLCIRHFSETPIQYDFMKGPLRETYKEKFCSRGGFFCDVEIFGNGMRGLPGYWKAAIRQILRKLRNRALKDRRI